MHSYPIGTTDKGCLTVPYNNLFCPQLCRSKLFSNPELKCVRTVAVSRAPARWGGSEARPQRARQSFCLKYSKSTSQLSGVSQSISSLVPVASSVILNQTLPTCTKLSLGKATESKHAKCYWKQKREGRRAFAELEFSLLPDQYCQTCMTDRKESDEHSWESAVTARVVFWGFFWTTGKR